MTEILVISHGNLAKEIVKIAEGLLEKPVKATPVCFDLELDATSYSQKLSNILNSLPQGEPVIVLTDLFGGTPSNLTIPFIRKDKLEVITGVNLPMLMYLLSQPEDTSFQDLCQGTRQAGEEAILIAGEFLS